LLLSESDDLLLDEHSLPLPDSVDVDFGDVGSLGEGSKVFQLFDCSKTKNEWGQRGRKEGRREKEDGRKKNEPVVGTQ